MLNWCKIGIHKWKNFNKKIYFEDVEGELSVEIPYRKCKKCGLKQRGVRDRFSPIEWKTIPNIIKDV